MMWLSFLKSNSEMMSNFLEWLEETKSQKLVEMRGCIGRGDLAKAQETEGEIKLLDTIKNQATMTDNEKRSLQEYKGLKAAK